MNSCSEYVSVGHPDKVADAIASHLLDEYLSHDPKTRFAMEVQLKDHVCNLAGEITSNWAPDKSEVDDMVKSAVRAIGYDSEYASRWPYGATLNADRLSVNSFISQQSPDIAQGVDADGWGDQGVFCGMATREAEYGHMPRDRYFAHEIGRRLYEAALYGEAPIGLDIKTQVSMTSGLNVEQVVVAAPMLQEKQSTARSLIADIVYDVLKKRNHSCDELVINGTGAYVVHSSVGDAGVVGRKLAVDFYGLNCPIGGGSPWGKDPTKADVTLNLMARYLAMRAIITSFEARDVVYTKIACCIGKSKCLVSYLDADHNVFRQETLNIFPSKTIRKFGLAGTGSKSMFFDLCKRGLFSEVDGIVEGEFKCI